MLYLKFTSNNRKLLTQAKRRCATMLTRHYDLIIPTMLKINDKFFFLFNIFVSVCTITVIRPNTSIFLFLLLLFTNISFLTNHLISHCYLILFFIGHYEFWFDFLQKIILYCFVFFIALLLVIRFFSYFY